MTIQRISTRHATPIAEARPNRIGIVRSSRFSFEEHLSRQASTRPLVDASQPGRQFAAVPDHSPSIREPSPQDVTASSPTLESSAAPSNSAQAQVAQARPFYVANPYSDPADPNLPEMIQDLTAAATPQSAQWTSANGLTTTGILNPFGLTKNNPSIGFYGAEPTTPRQP